MPIAIYDKKNGITGCKKGSFEYLHEKEHERFDKDHSLIIYLAQMSEFYTIILITLTFFVNWFKYLDIVGILIMLFCFIYEEVYCSLKAIEKFK